MSASFQRVLLMVIVVGSLAALAHAQTADNPPVSQPSTSLTTIWPDLGWSTLAWFGAVAVLILTFRVRPLFSARNLDGLVLAAMCVLLALRDTAGAPAPDARPWQWWGYLGLTVAAGYWFLRGVYLLLSWKSITCAGWVTPGVRFVLVVVGLALCVQQLLTAPPTLAARDGLVGGLYFNDTGYLPYGEVAGVTHHSPLLYLLNAGAARVAEPTTVSDTGEVRRLAWSEPSEWRHPDWTAGLNLTSIRLVNLVLFLLILVGLNIIGRRLAGEEGSWLVIALFCVLPSTLHALAHPDILLPAALLTWAFAFALLPVVGGLLSMACLVFAGLAWPWAWLFLPIALGWFWRRGWQALGSTLGLAGAAALCVWGLTTLVQPALPHSQASVATAGLQPLYTAQLVEGGTVELTRRDVEAEEAASTAVTGRLWKALLTGSQVAVPLGQRVRVVSPAGGPLEPVYFRQIDPTPEARPVLQAEYREASAALGSQTPVSAILTAGRTLLEATWLLPEAQPRTVDGAWAYWSGTPQREGIWRAAQRVVKGAAGLLALWAALVVFISGRIRPRQLLGALLLVGALALAGSDAGAAANWIVLLPLIVALWAVVEPLDETAGRSSAKRRITAQAGPYATVQPVTPAERAYSDRPLPERGPAPRITLDANAPESRP